MRIAKLDIQSFRGIPGHCSLDFRDKKGNSCSTIIYGGNGCGKSSIVDAIEFNLQGRIERSKTIKNLRRPSALSIYYEDYKQAQTMVEFDDGSISKREIQVIWEQESNKYSFIVEPNKELEAFSFSPIVLRRNDIISFNMCTVDQKQLLLSEFFYDFRVKEKTTDNPTILKLRQEILSIKSERNPLIEKLSSILDIDQKEIRQAINTNLVSFVKSRFAPIGKMQFTKSGKIKQSIHQNDYQKALDIAKKTDEISEKIREKNKEISSYTPKKEIATTNKFQVLNERYDDAAKYLSTAFNEISNADYVDSIGIAVANTSAISFEIIVTLNNGWDVPPERIFSEANYDLMILLLYVSMIRVGAEKGQAKVLVLDDVLQSVDAAIRTRFMSYILREFSDWQLFITCHDRAWLNQLRHLFNNPEKGGRHQFKEFDIVKWSFEGGPIIQENNSTGVDESLKKALETNDIKIIASTSGPFFEMICEKLSGFLNCQISRNPEDKYTIGDLWKGVKPALINIGLEQEVKDINNFMFIRNMIGCHYSTWAEETSDFEVLSFANAVLSLYDKTFCKDCLSWISGKYYENKSCHCGNLFYRKTKKD